MNTGFFLWSNNFRKKNMLLMVCLGAIVLFLASCGYHFPSFHGDRLTSVQSLWVSFIGMEIDSPSAQTVLRRSLQEEFHALRGLYPSGSEAAADLRVSGRLRSYATRAVSYTARDQVKQYRLTIEVDLELYRKNEVTPCWKGVLQSYQDYPAHGDLALQRSAEEAALVSASHILAQKLLMAIEQSY